MLRPSISVEGRTETALHTRDEEENFLEVPKLREEDPKRDCLAAGNDPERSDLELRMETKELTRDAIVSYSLYLL